MKTVSDLIKELLVHEQMGHGDALVALDDWSEGYKSPTLDVQMKMTFNTRVSGQKEPVDKLLILTDYINLNYV